MVAQDDPDSTPLGDGRSDRDAKGRFVPGHPGGPGNPLGGTIGKLRAALVAAVTVEDIQEIAQTLIGAAKSGDMAATRELLLRTLGRPVELDLLERLERIEAILAEGTR